MPRQEFGSGYRSNWYKEKKTRSNTMTRVKARLRIAVFVWICTALMSGSGQALFAQVTAGAIRGIVNDQTGAAVPDAEIEATNLSTNLKFTTTSTQAGNYLLGNLPIGDYKVTGQKAG